MIYELSMHKILNRIIIEMIKKHNNFFSEENLNNIFNEYTKIKNECLRLRFKSFNIETFDGETLIFMDEILKDINEILYEIDIIRKNKK